MTKDIMEKLCDDLFRIDIKIEFLEDEIKLANEFIVDNDYHSFINLIENKKIIANEVNKDIILGNVENLWKFITDQVYNLWDSNLEYSEFLEKLSPYEKIALQFSNFDWQIENNGIYGWYINKYNVDFNNLINFLEKSNFSRKEQFLNIMENFKYVQEQIKNLDQSNDFYERDCNTRYEYLKGCEKDYNSLRDSWINYFQNYLFDNLPKEYLHKIEKYNYSEINI